MKHYEIKAQLLLDRMEAYKYFSGGVYKYFSGVYKYFYGAGAVYKYFSGILYINTSPVWRNVCKYYYGVFRPRKGIGLVYIKILLRHGVYKHFSSFSGAVEVYNYFSAVYSNTYPAPFRRVTRSRASDLA